MQRKISVIFTILVSFILSGVFNVRAQPGSVVLKDGADNVMSSHASITDAYSALPATLAQAYIIETGSGYNATAETFPIVFTAKAGASAANTITLRPAAGVTAQTISANLPGNGLLILDDADHIIIDGRPGGTGTGKAYTFSNLGTTSSTNTIILRNGACFNRVQYCNILNATTSSAGRGVLLGTSVSNPAGNSDNLFQYCYFPSGRYNFNSSGTTANPNTRNTIFGCEFENMIFAGVWGLAGTGKMLIDSCSFYGTRASGDGLFFGILFDSQTDTVTIANNRMYDIQNQGSGTLRYIHIRSVVSGRPNFTDIHNNFLSMMKGNATLNNAGGIEYSGGNPVNARIVHNTIRIGGTLASGGTAGSVGSSALLLSATSSASQYEIQNNIFINERSGGTAGLQHVAMAITDASSNFVRNYNTFNATSGALVRIGTGVFTDIPSYQLAVAPLEAHSNNIAVQLVSDTDLHLTGSSLHETGLDALPITGILRDIDGQIRGNPTKRGADEAFSIYVDSTNGNDNNTGNSWAQAYKTLSKALSVANTSDSAGSILVAKGTYYPTGDQSATNRDSAFLVSRGGLKIYGGYPAGGGARNVIANPTILSGAINTASDNDNSYHVLVIAGIQAVTDSIVIDGFCIEKAYGDGSGATLYNGISLSQDSGGGVVLKSNSDNTNIAIRNCIIRDNTIDAAGAGILNEDTWTNLINCIFINNHAGTIGGGLFNHSSSSKTVNCTFYGNNAVINGGGVYNDNNSDALFTNCIIWGNTGGGNYINNVSSASVLTYCLLQDGSYPGGGNINTDPKFVNPAIGNIALQSCSPAINAGNNDSIPIGITTDIAGNQRIFGTTVDIGAYEYQGLPYIPDHDTVSIVICNGDSITISGTAYYHTTGFYTDTLTTFSGCDSIITLDLSVLPAPVTLPTLYLDSCGKVTFEGNIYTADTLILDTLYTVNPVCDSIYLSISITILPVFSEVDTVTICENGLPYVFGSQTLTTGGSYTETFPAVTGCDSIVNLYLIVNDTFLHTDVVTICEDALPYTFGSQSLTVPGAYTETFPTIQGCDSTVTLTLHVNDTFIVNDAVTICTDQLPYVFGAQNLTESGTYTEIFKTITNCDSTVQLTLQVNDTVIVNNTITICANQTPYVFGMQNLTTSGTYTEIFKTTTNCDSTVTLTLQVNDTFIVNDAVTICTDQLPYAFGTQNLTESGTYTEMFKTITNCDSTVTLTLQVNDTFIINDAAIICADQAPYVFGTQNLTTTGTYTEVFQTVTNCDSTVTLTLQVNDTFIVTTSLAICAVDFPYDFGSRTLTEPGSYTELFTTLNGCDSIVTLNLSIAQPRIHYVSSAASGNADGSSWANASNDLQEVINNACYGDTIFVASGTYRPNRPVYDLYTIDPLNPDNAFVLKKDVSLFGGFSGTENSLSERTLSVPPSVLSGDLDNSGTLNDNDAYHVIVAAGDIGNAQINGFRISGGHARGNGVLQWNGYAINKASGGGLYVRNTSLPLNNITLSGNAAESNGGGIYQDSSSSLHVTNSLVTGNRSGHYGGGIYSAENSTLSLLQVTTAGNYALKGGGLYTSTHTQTEINNSIIYNNSSSISNNGNIQVEYSTIEGAHPGYGNLQDNPLFMESIAPQQSPSTQGDYRLQTCSPAIGSGNSSLLPAYLTHDIAGQNRIKGQEADMGAHENNDFTLNNLASASLSANAICVDNDNWWHFYHDTEDKIILSLHLQGQSLGDITATTHLNDRYGTGNIYTLHNPFRQTGTFYPANRSWIVNSAVAPASPVKVRFYFSETDLADLKANHPLANIEDLIVYKVEGTNAWDKDAEGYTSYTHSINATGKNYTFGTYKGLQYVEFEVTNFSTGTIAIPPSEPLPVELLSFSGRLKDEAVQLQWETANEANLSHYEVERSHDGRQWQRIHKEAARNQATNHYETRDGEPGAINFYRLKVTDREGLISYSHTVQVNLTGKAQGQPVIEAYPNPNSGSFELSITGIGTEEVKMTLYDILGREVHSQTVREGVNRIDFQNQVSGVYTLRINIDSREYNRKIVVDRN